jgi:hypothetical protein
MAEVTDLPRVLVHRTRFGTRIIWQRGAGLLALDETGRRRAIGPAELRRCYPEAWPAWVRSAAMLPAGEIHRSRPGPQGGEAA